MNKFKLHIVFLSVVFLLAQLSSMAADSVKIVLPDHASPRMKYGAEQLTKALKRAGYTVVPRKTNSNLNLYHIMIADWDSDLFRKISEGQHISYEMRPGKEGFHVFCFKKKRTVVAGADASGVLYGCLELARLIDSAGRIPADRYISDQPEMVLRGACIGLQKPYYLPGRTVYEYPYTPETFPWFYDKQLWIQYLDSMVNNRMNSLYLWNGHPFASLVRLKEYPYAVEVSNATFRKNEEMYRFLTTEADKRGIWVIQMFYNIIVSKPFAEKHNIKTQERERPIIPLIADYTRKSIAAFVKKYPNVGLMVCLGEAMEGTGPDDVEWFTKTIIPGVKDGLAALRKKEEPPIVLRAHDTDAPTVMKAALPFYKNLYTEAKFNGEALTTPEPRGAWVELHQTLSRIGTVQIENVHIMANLEPFRYGSVDFIQRSVKGMHSIMEGNGLHLYPQASYWDWPYSADSVNGQRLLQVERDWIWYAAWSRYAWKSQRDRQEEIHYWSQQLANKFGCNEEQGKLILDAYEQSGEIAPKLLRRFGITDGNRQTLTLGMLMTQLINPTRYGLFTLLYESESPEGEMLTQYAEKDWKGIAHLGETPVQIIREVRAHGRKAVAAIDAVSSAVKNNREEFSRLQNDMHCYQLLAEHYAAKAEAAVWVLRYKYSNAVSDLDKAFPLLAESVSKYRELATLTKSTYLYANSMQTQQRKIPIRGVNGTFKTWTEVLVPFENELEHFRKAIDSLKKATGVAAVAKSFINANVNWISPSRKVMLDSGAVVFADSNFMVKAIAPELKGLVAPVLVKKDQLVTNGSFSFTNTQPVKVLVGYFNSKDAAYLQPPQLETNASANDRGQAEIRIANAMVIAGLPAVNVHSYSFQPGTNELKLGKGIFLILGFVNDHQFIPVYDAGLSEGGVKKEVDWLFE